MRDLLFAADLRHEPVEKRVRADDVVDSTRAVLVWEPRRVTPLYAVPAADIAAPLTPGGEAVRSPTASSTRASRSPPTPRRVSR